MNQFYKPTAPRVSMIWDMLEPPQSPVPCIYGAHYTRNRLDRITANLASVPIKSLGGIVADTLPQTVVLSTTILPQSTPLVISHLVPNGQSNLDLLANRRCDWRRGIQETVLLSKRGVNRG